MAKLTRDEIIQILEDAHHAGRLGRNNHLRRLRRQYFASHLNYLAEFSFFCFSDFYAHRFCLLRMHYNDSFMVMSIFFVGCIFMMLAATSCNKDQGQRKPTYIFKFHSFILIIFDFSFSILSLIVTRRQEARVIRKHARRIAAMDILVSLCTTILWFHTGLSALRSSIRTSHEAHLPSPRF